MPAYTCGCCRRQFVTDNAWIYCELDNVLPVRARFCCEQCRSQWVAAKAFKEENNDPDPREAPVDRR
jgi:hypothetical protein